MKIEMNEHALNTALTAALGQQGREVIEILYKLLDDAERHGFEAGFNDGLEAGEQATYQEAHADGYGAGFRDGVDVATGGEQPTNVTWDGAVVGDGLDVDEDEFVEFEEMLDVARDSGDECRCDACINDFPYLTAEDFRNGR